MKKSLSVFVLVISSAFVYSQSAYSGSEASSSKFDAVYSSYNSNRDYHSEGIEFAHLRIENSFCNKNLSDIEDLLSSVVTMRLDDKVYLNIANIEAMDLLNKYFTEKENVIFRFTTGNSGKMVYKVNGEKNKSYVDLGFLGSKIKTINISNNPSATAFIR